MHPTFKEKQLIDACRHIFGEEPDISVDFLNYLQPEGLKSAFRRKAIETHPDTSAYSEKDEKSTDIFVRVLESYRFVNRYLETKQRTFDAHITNPVRKYSSENLTQSHKTVKFGRFLLEIGAINFRTLIASLSWQRSTYHRIGKIMKDSGLLSASDVLKVVTSDLREPFGERCIRLKLITEKQLEHSLFLQKCQKKPIGEYFTANRHFSEIDLKKYLKLHRLNISETLKGEKK